MLQKSYTIGDDVLSQSSFTENGSSDTAYLLYDGHGSTRQLANAFGVVTAKYAYNGRNRLTGLQINDAQATLLNSFGYQLNAVGHRTRIDEANGRTRLFQYDNLNRLTSEQITGDSAGVNGAVSYVHDLVGNRIASASTLPGVVSQSNSYSVNDRLDSDTCDDNGNTVAAPGITAGDVYDAWNRLVRRTKPDGTTVDLGYDHVGNRVSKTVSTATNETFTAYLVDNNSLTGYAQVLEELRDDGTGSLEVFRTYAVGHDVLSQTTHTPTYPHTHTRYYLYDGQGSVWGLADEAGTVTDYYAYDAFGIHLYDAGAGTPNTIRYTGEQFDPDLGQYYLRARFYEPTRGCFWTQDSYEGSPSDPISLHKYLYANANPVIYSDPSGRFSLTEMCQSVQIAGMYARVAVPHAVRTINCVFVTLVKTLGARAQVWMITELGQNTFRWSIYRNIQYLSNFEKGLWIVKNVPVYLWLIDPVAIWEGQFSKTMPMGPTPAGAVGAAGVAVYAGFRWGPVLYDAVLNWLRTDPSAQTGE